MSRGLGKLQRAILDALPAHEHTNYPGVYNLFRLRVALAQEWGKTYEYRKRYGGTGIAVDSSFAACFSRAVRTLMERGLLKIDDSPWGIYVPRGHWQLPHVRRTDKR